MSAFREVEVNGQKYPVRYDMNALCEFEDITGKSLIKGMVDSDVRCIRALVYVGLKCGHDFKQKGVTKFTHSINDVGQMLDLTSGVVNRFMEVLNESLGVKKEEAGDASAEQPGE